MRDLVARRLEKLSDEEANESKSRRCFSGYEALAISASIRLNRSRLNTVADRHRDNNVRCDLAMIAQSALALRAGKRLNGATYEYILGNNRKNDGLQGDGANVLGTRICALNAMQVPS